MQDAILKADVLIEAMGWIRQFRDKITVIKLGGSVMEDPESLRHLLVDVVFMESVGMRPIVVHGGGAAISRAMAEVNIEPHNHVSLKFHDRYGFSPVGEQDNEGGTKRVVMLACPLIS